MVERAASHALRDVLGRLAPGTDLREGLERILRGRTGALIVLGFDRTVEEMSDGGFQINIDFSPTRLRELSKMDGAVILNDAATRILRANVQLMPDSTIPTVESGTRHRTAERVALQTKLPIISVSHSMSIISLYFDGIRYVLADPAAILARANQALATLQRYRARLDEVAQALSALEIEDFTTVRDVMTVVQRLLMVRRIAERDRQRCRRTRHRRPTARPPARRTDQHHRGDPRPSDPRLPARRARTDRLRRAGRTRADR